MRDYADQNEAAAQARARLEALPQPLDVTQQPALATRKVWALPDMGNVEGAPSPDGRYISFTAWDTGDLAIRNLETGKSLRLTDKGPWERSEEFAMWSRWSPDGKQIAYDWYDGKCMDLRVIAMEGGNPRTLFDNENGAWIQTYDWSPDSRQVLIFLEKKDRQRQTMSSSRASSSSRAP